jgi:hypothetical protein
VTQEIRLYLHEGADTTVITGNGGNGILVRVIGGNGNNVVLDSASQGSRTRLYDVGQVSDVRYPSDSLMTHKTFNRRPLLPGLRRPDTGAARLWQEPNAHIRPQDRT